jgi:hypothetical protein
MRPVFQKMFLKTVPPVKGRYFETIQNSIFGKAVYLCPTFAGG